MSPFSPTFLVFSKYPRLVNLYLLKHKMLTCSISIFGLSPLSIDHLTTENILRSKQSIAAGISIFIVYSLSSILVPAKSLHLGGGKKFKFAELIPRSHCNSAFISIHESSRSIYTHCFNFRLCYSISELQNCSNFLIIHNVT